MTLDRVVLFLDESKLPAALLAELQASQIEVAPYDSAVPWVQDFTTRATAEATPLILLVDLQQINMAMFHAIPEAMRLEERSLVLVAKVRHD